MPRTKSVKEAKAPKKATVAKKTVKRVKGKLVETVERNGTGKGYLSKGLTAKEYQEQRTATPIHWSERRIALVKAMRKLKATDATSARSATDIAEAAEFDGLDARMVKLHCDIYRGNELKRHGFVDSVKHEGVRELQYFLTPAGAKTKFENMGRSKKTEETE